MSRVLLLGGPLGAKVVDVKEGSRALTIPVAPPGYSPFGKSPNEGAPAFGQIIYEPRNRTMELLHIWEPRISDRCPK